MDTQTLLQEQMKEFNKQFDSVEFLHGVPVSLPPKISEAIKQWHTQSIKQILQAEVQYLCGQIPEACDCTGAKFECEHWGRHQAITNQINRLTYIIEML
jgi:hypothetical protein